MSQLVECIPNFSEARRPEVIDEIVGQITSVQGTRLLDRSSDLDHNRTVLTFAGTPEAVEEAAFRAIKKAAQLIDLNLHVGEHPRIGATDVVPFVPLSDVGRRRARSARDSRTSAEESTKDYEARLGPILSASLTTDPPNWEAPALP
jgi:glutamate formiminotransferase